MRLVPWGQMLADVQASGFTPISWLRFSSRTALTTTCTASNIRAADSWGEGGGGGRMAERQLSQAPHSLRQGPSLQECGTRQAGSEDGSRGSGGGAFPRESDGYGEKARAARVSGGVMQPLSPSHAATRLFGGRGSQRGLARMASQVTSTGRCPRA